MKNKRVESLIKRRLLRAAIMTHRGKVIYNATGDSSMLAAGWEMYRNVVTWSQLLDSKLADARSDYFMTARKALESR
jgi:hypothetical protein